MRVSALRRGGLERFTVSRTDRTRPYRVQIADPLNRRFRMVGSDATQWNWFWKKMHAATQCWCCSNKYWTREKRKCRDEWKREARMDGFL